MAMGRLQPPPLVTAGYHQKMITVPSGGELKARTRENLIDGRIMGVGPFHAEIERKTREGTTGVVKNTITQTRTKMDGPAITTGGIDTAIATGNAALLGRRSAVGGQGIGETLNHGTGYGHVHSVLREKVILTAVGFCEDRTHPNFKTMVQATRLNLGRMRGIHFQTQRRTDLRTARTMRPRQVQTPTH